VVASKILDLLGLLVDDVGGMGKLAVNQLLVGLVDERCEEDDGGREEGKTPEWDDLDEIVRDESTEESSCRRKDILCEDDSLRLDNEEVEQLMEITSERVKSLLGNSVVFSWANLGDEAGTQESLSSTFNDDSDEKSHPCKLKSIAQDIEVSGCEDEEDDGSVGNTGSSWVVP